MVKGRWILRPKEEKTEGIETKGWLFCAEVPRQETLHSRKFCWHERDARASAGSTVIKPNCYKKCEVWRFPTVSVDRRSRDLFSETYYNIFNCRRMVLVISFLHAPNSEFLSALFLINRVAKKYTLSPRPK